MDERERWLEEMNLFTIVALSDSAMYQNRMREHQFPLIYLFSETDDNRSSCLSIATGLYRNGVTDRIAMAANSKNPGYSGFEEWLRALYVDLIPDLRRLKRIDVVPIVVSGNLNTFSEARAMLRYAQEHGMGTVGVVAPAFHMPRAFLSTISVSIRECPDIKVYALSGWVPDWWHKEVLHSQGTLKATRVHLIRTERERIARYQREGHYYDGGDLVSFQQAFEYLRLRDWCSPA